MPAVTIEAPQDLVDRLIHLPQKERDIYTLAALTAGRAALSPEEAALDHQEMIAAVEEALAEVEADKDRPFEEYLQELRFRTSPGGS